MIVLDLPAPLSVNRTRKIDWAEKPKISRWIKAADAIVMSQGKLSGIKGPFEINITLSGSISQIDPDNGIKQLLDYLRRIEVIEDDNPKLARRLVIEWGTAPEGARITVKPWSAA